MKASEATLNRVNARNEGIDVCRFVMAMLIIILHTVWEVFGKEPALAPWWAQASNIISRAAVPFFFVASGYYLRMDAPMARLVGRPVQRLMPMYIAWMLAFHLALYIWPISEVRILGISDLLSGGAAYHLWFLPALAGALIFAGVGVRLFGVLPTALVAVALALVGPVLYNYHSILGISEYPARLGSINRQLAAPLFVVIGVQLRDRFNLSARGAAVMVVIAYLLLFAETGFLVHATAKPAITYDFVVATFLLGPAMFIFARSVAGQRWSGLWSKLGGLSLAIYLCHLFFIWAAKDLIGGTGLPAVALIVGLVAIFAVVFAAAVTRTPILRRLAI